jgi:hypothetical protein
VLVDNMQWLIDSGWQHLQRALNLLVSPPSSLAVLPLSLLQMEMQHEETAKGTLKGQGLECMALLRHVACTEKL